MVQRYFNSPFLYMELPAEILSIPHLAISIAFAVGLTQMIKDEYHITSHLTIRLMAVLLLLGSSVLYTFMPEMWQPYYLLFLLSVGTPGVVGLWKEGKEATGANVDIQKAQNVDVKTAAVKYPEI